MKLTQTNFYRIAATFVISALLVGLTQFSQAEPGMPYGAGRTTTGNQVSSNRVPANLVQVQVEKVGSTATLGGTVIPYQEVTLAAQLPGRVEYIAGHEGDWFKKSDELIRIDDDDLLAQQRSALAELENSRLAMRNAGVQYSRELWAPQSKNINKMPGMGMPALFDQMFTSNMGNWMGYGNPEVDRYGDLYAQGTQLNQSRSQVTRAQSRLDEIAARLRDTRSLAPFDGVIARKLVEVGDTVQPGQHLIVFSDIEYLQVKVDVPIRLMQGINALTDSDRIMIRLDDPQKKLVKGRLAQKYPVADAQRHTVTIKIDIKKTEPATPGMYAEVMIPESNSRKLERLVIPAKAVIKKSRGSLPVVYIWNAERQRKERRYIRLGTHIDDQRVTVLSGLKKTDTLVIDDWR